MTVFARFLVLYLHHRQTRRRGLSFFSGRARFSLRLRPVPSVRRKEAAALAKGKYQKWLEPDGLLLLEGWAREGLTDEQIAHNMGVAYSTFREWLDKFPALSAALKKGKAPVDLEVENALLKRALGFTYTEVATEDSDDGGHKVKRTVKYVLPDTTAQIFWLKNRRPDRWREKQQIEVGSDTMDRVKEILGGVESVIE